MNINNNTENKEIENIGINMSKEENINNDNKNIKSVINLLNWPPPGPSTKIWKGIFGEPSLARSKG